MSKKLKALLLRTVVFLPLAYLVVPPVFAAVAGTTARWVASQLQFQGSSGNDAFQFVTDGLRGRFSSCTDCFVAGDSTHLIVGTGSGAGYVASGTPFLLNAIRVKAVVSVVTLDGIKLPAHPFTVTDITYDVSASGTGGTTNNTFQVSDGTNTCNCAAACNQATGPQIALCVAGAGTGCAFASNAALTFGYSALGNCVVATTLLNNINVRGNWQ